MSTEQYSTDIRYTTFMWQHHHRHHQNDVVVLEHPKQPLFEKPLTPSDVGKLNRLVIPKQHAEKYFPLSSAAGDTTTVAEKGVLLCFEDDEDGKPWRFRYSYWNSSQSYVLTKGWSRFVKDKHLDAGDVVFFLRHPTDVSRLFIGCRRRAAAGDGVRPSSSSSEPYRFHEPNGSLLGSDNPLQYYPSEYPHAGRAVENRTGNSKTVRLFGVNLECHLDSDRTKPSTPVGSSIYCSTHDPSFFPQQHYPSPSYMDISFSGGVNQMRNPE